jgi:hypothetical protein
MMKKLLLSLMMCASTAQATVPFFALVDDAGQVHHIQRAHVDPLLRIMTCEQLQEASEFIAVNPVMMDNGEYYLHAHVRGNGGGAVGASVGFWVGKSLVYVGTIGVLNMVGLVATPATGGLSAVATGTAGAVIAAPVEIASNSVGIGFAVLFGTLTGPI